MNIVKNISIIIILSIGISSFSYSQRLTSYWMQHLPQSNSLNPAKQSGCKFFLEFPSLPNADLNLNHSGFTMNDFFKPLPNVEDSFMIDLDGIEKALHDKNKLSLEAQLSIVNFGLRLKNGLNINAGINYKLSEYFQYPKSLIEIRRGNYRANGTPLVFNFKQNLNLIREIYIGASKTINENLTLGAKLKYYSGYVNIKTNKLNIDWYTKRDDMWDWKFNSDFDIKTASVIPWEFTRDSAGFIDGIKIEDIDQHKKELIFPKNTGLGLDAGIEYTFFNKLRLSASVIDFGYIKWKTNPKIISQKGDFDFNGIDIAKYLRDPNKDDNDNIGKKIGNDMLDSIRNFFNPNIKEESYLTSMNSKLYLGANMKITNWLDGGFLYRGVFFNKSAISSYTFSLNANFFKAWSYALSYSIMNGAATNLGMGLACKIGPLQAYIISDNLALPLWALTDNKFFDKRLRNTKSFNVSFGLNIIICGKSADRGLME